MRQRAAQRYQGFHLYKDLTNSLVCLYAETVKLTTAPNKTGHAMICGEVTMTSYLVPGLIVSMSIIFLLVCLQGFQKALRQEHTFRALLIKMKKERAWENRLRLIEFPRASKKAQLRQNLQQAIRSGRRFG
jgi:hypothetical protein